MGGEIIKKNENGSRWRCLGGKKKKNWDGGLSRSRHRKEVGANFLDRKEGFSMKDIKGGVWEEKWKKGFGEEQIREGGEEKLRRFQKRGHEETGRGKGLIGWERKKKSEKKRKTENKERRDRFREWRIQEENK